MTLSNLYINRSNDKQISESLLPKSIPISQSAAIIIAPKKIPADRNTNILPIFDVKIVGAKRVKPKRWNQDSKDKRVDLKKMMVKMPQLVVR